MTAPDTRFDRVWRIARSPFEDEAFSRIPGGKKVIVAGSIWPSDLPLLRKLDFDRITLLIAPHEIHDKNIRRISEAFDLQVLRSSQWKFWTAWVNWQNIIDMPTWRLLVADTAGVFTTSWRLRFTVFPLPTGHAIKNSGKPVSCCNPERH